MKDWATLPYELLKTVVDILFNQNDKKSLTQFQLVCKHWNKPAAYLPFHNVNILDINSFSSLVRLILRNPEIGSAIKYVDIDVTKEEEDVNLELHSTGYFENDPLVQESVDDFEEHRNNSYKALLAILLRFIPNAKSLRFSAEQMASWYLIMNKNAKYLYSLEVMPPPTRIGHFFVYNPIAWQLCETLRKVTFVNRGNIDPESIVESDAGLVLRAEHFISLTEIRVELLEPRCHIPELELVLDHIPTTVEFVVFATSFTLLNIDASKLQFPEVDTTTIKPLPHVERLRGLHCYFCDDNAIKYITHKFPNVDEFIYTILDDPWNFYARFNLPDTPNQLSPSVQTMYFEYFMKMSTFDVFLVFAKEELPSLMSRWMAVANSTIPEESVSLTLINNGFVEPNCSYVRWKKLGWPRSFEIIINFNDTLPWTYGLYIGSIGRCLENIALEYIEINSEILSQIYEGCPVLNHLLFDGVTIPNAIDTGEITSKLKEMTFSNIGNSSSQHISSITKSLPDLFSLFLYDVDLVVPKEEMTEDNSFPYKDLEFDISSTCAYQIRYAATYDFVPPWCIFVNDDRLLVNQDAFKEGPYRQLIFMEEASPEDFKVLEERIAPSKRNYRYCMRIKCKLLHCFNFSKNSEELPDNRDNDALAQDDITFVIN